MRLGAFAREKKKEARSKKQEPRLASFAALRLCARKKKETRSKSEYQDALEACLRQAGKKLEARKKSREADYNFFAVLRLCERKKKKDPRDLSVRRGGRVERI